MSGRKLRWLGAGLVASAGSGVLALTAITNPAFAYGDDIGLVIGGSGTPIPGSDYVESADNLYLNPIYGDLTYYQATPTNPYGEGLFTPEGAEPLETGVHSLPLNYPLDSDGFPSDTTSVGQGMTILENTIAANTAAGDTTTVFGYSQSSIISSYVMQQLDPSGTPQPDSGLDFLLVGDPSNPDGGVTERFGGFETLSGQTVSDPLIVPSLGTSFNVATPADDYVTSIYTLEYDGYADFPQYPLNLLSDLNAFLGFAELHGTYLDGGVDGSGPTAEQIADAILLPGSAADGTADSLTNYYLIDETPPLVSEIDGISKPLGDLLGPDLTVLINLGYGSLTQGYSPGDANVDTPFGLWPTDISASDLISALESGAQQGWSAFVGDLQDPSSSLDSATAGQSFTDLVSALQADAADPSATFTELVNAISSAASTAYTTLLPLADIGNSAITTLPAYDLSLFSDNLQTGDILDALGLPIAADTALYTLLAGFGLETVEAAFSQIAADFSGLF